MILIDETMPKILTSEELRKVTVTVEKRWATKAKEEGLDFTNYVEGLENTISDLSTKYGEVCDKLNELESTRFIK